MNCESLTPQEIAHLPATALLEIVLAFRAALYPGGNPDHEWSAQTLGDLAALCERFGLTPDADRRQAG